MLETLVGQRDEVVGGLAHRRDDDDDVVAVRLVKATFSATARMRSGSATEVPPYFWTIRATGPTRYRRGRRPGSPVPSIDVPRPAARRLVRTRGARQRRRCWRSPASPATRSYRFAAPFLATIAAGLGVSLGRLGVALAIGELVTLSAPLIGRVVDAVPRRAAMVAGPGDRRRRRHCRRHGAGLPQFVVGLCLLSLGKVGYDIALGRVDRRPGAVAAAQPGDRAHRDRLVGEPAARRVACSALLLARRRRGTSPTSSARCSCCAPRSPCLRHLPHDHAASRASRRHGVGATTGVVAHVGRHDRAVDGAARRAARSSCSSPTARGSTSTSASPPAASPR